MNVKIPQCRPLPDTPVVRRRYARPCVRTEWHGGGLKWIPVVGTVHDDAEHIMADFLHIHVDFRFLCQRDRQRLLHQTLDEDDSGINPVFIVPISEVVPADIEKPITIAEAIRNDHPTEEWLSIRMRPYLGPYPTYPRDERIWWHAALTAAYAGSQLIDGRICPHQGTDLAGIPPDDDGTVTCPLHGLRWCARTGQIIDSALNTATHPA